MHNLSDGAALRTTKRELTLLNVDETADVLRTTPSAVVCRPGQVVTADDQSAMRERDDWKRLSADCEAVQ